MAEDSRARLDAHFLGTAAEPAAGQAFDHSGEERMAELPERPRSRKPGQRDEESGREYADGDGQTPGGGARYGPGLPWPGGSENGPGFRPLTSAG